MSTELVSRRFDNGLLDVERGVKGREKTKLLLLHIPFTILPSLTIPIHFHSLQALSNSLFESTRPAGVRLRLLAVEEPSRIYVYIYL